MKYLALFLLSLHFSYATSPREEKVKALEDGGAFSDVSKQIIELGKIAEKEIRKEYSISNQEELVLYCYFFMLGDFSEALEPNSTPHIMYYFGVKSSLVTVKRDGLFGTDTIEERRYRLSYRATINLESETISTIDLIND